MGSSVAFVNELSALVAALSTTRADGRPRLDGRVRAGRTARCPQCVRRPHPAVKTAMSVRSDSSSSATPLSTRPKSSSESTSALYDFDDDSEQSDIESYLIDVEIEKRGKVQVFGGLLDVDLVGGKLSPVRSPGAPDLEAHYSCFLTGVQHFRVGNYREAAADFRQAVKQGQKNLRVSGQYELWYAQALNAAGNHEEAMGVLTRLRKHIDSDVRCVARKIEEVYNAPELRLPRNSFVYIPPFEETKPLPGVRQQLRGLRVSRSYDNYVPYSTGEPEKYTLEWYMSKPKKQSSDSAKDMSVPVILAAGLFFILMLAGSSYGI